MSDLFMFLAGIALLVCGYGTFGLVFPRLPLIQTRKRAAGIALGAGVMIFIFGGVGQSLMTPEQRAKQTLQLEQREQQERAREASAKEQAARAEVEEQRRAALTPREPDPNDDAECRKTLDCWGTKHATTAAVRCKAPVELLAKNDFEWTDGLLDQKFTRYKWKNEATGEVTYIGDKIKFQNGFGAWIFHTYECDLDASGEKVTDVRASPGRIGQ